MDFYEVDDCLAAAGALGSPAELQGMLCGRLCSGNILTEQDLMATTAEFLTLEDDGLQSVAELARNIHDELRIQLLDGQLGLSLLLPEDDEEMPRRLGALGEWCQGFLVGLGQGGLSDPAQLTPEVHEILEDLTAIAQVDDEAEMAVEDDGDEADYTELVEYVRVVVMTLYEELANSGGDKPAEPTLH